MKKAIRLIADTEAFALVTHRLEDSSNTHASNTSWDEVSRKEEFISPLRFTFVRAKETTSFQLHRGSRCVLCAVSYFTIPLKLKAGRKKHASTYSIKEDNLERETINRATLNSRNNEIVIEQGIGRKQSDVSNRIAELSIRRA